MIKQITEIENLLLQERLDFSLDNPIFKFETSNDLLVTHLKSFLDSDNLDFRKAAFFIIISSKIKENLLYSPMLKTVILLDDFEINKKFLLYMNNLDEKILINFLYTIVLTLEGEKFTYFIDIISLKFSEERATLLFFLLESFQLSDTQIRQIYIYLFNKNKYKTIDEFYYKSPIIEKFIESLKEKELLKISYKDLENPDSLLRKKLKPSSTISYFYNEDEKHYQLWIHVSEEKANEISTLKGINFNTLIHFPGSLMLYFQFHTEYSVFPLKIDLYLPNRHDSAFLYHLLKEKKIDLVFINDNNEILKKFDFIFQDEILFKLMNQSWLSKNFRDFEWLHIEEYMDLIEKGEFYLIDIPVSIFRKVHFDISLFRKILKKIEGSHDMSLYFGKFSLTLYTENDLEVLNKKELEEIVKTYMSIIDKNFPYFILFISNANEDLIKYMSYLLNDDFSRKNITHEVIKRLIFITKYLKIRDIDYYEILEKIASKFKVELSEEFFKKLESAKEILE